MAKTQQRQQKQHQQQSGQQGRHEQHAQHEHHILPLRTYFIVFIALLLLLGATVGVNYVDLGPFSIAIALLIAGIKAVIIILYFMHVKFSPKLIWLAASAAFFWLGIMFVLTLTDYISRSWIPVPGH